MAKDSAIEWTDATWNPFMGCTKVSEGCKNCYMFREQKQYGHDPSVLRKSKTTFRDPLKWKEPKMVFVCSWSDFFHEDVPFMWAAEAWQIMKECQRHTFLLLTKRPENFLDMLPGDFPSLWPNVWLGVTVENQEMANLRIPLLLDIPVAKRFVSVEPMLGPVKFWTSWLPGVCFELDGTPWPSVDWVIAGGESGRDFREMKEEWALDLRDQCVVAGVPFFFKQWSAYRPKKDPRGMMLDGREWREIP